jgi:hypothetical protein
MATAKILPSSNREVLEDGDAAILPEPQVEDGEEFVELDKPEPAAPVAEPKPAAAKPAPAAKPAVVAAPAAAAEADDVPAELKGKTPAELAKMYREAQSLIGRQGSELGDLRRRADQFIHANLAAMAKAKEAPAAAPAAAAAPAQMDEAEFFRAPQEAIARAIESSPVIKQIRETLGKAAEETAISRATAATERFNGAHPDAGAILQDPEFRQWVQASRVRTDLLRRAHQHYDFDAGDEVFGTWKALKGVGKPAAAAAAPAEADAAAAAAAASAAGAALAKRKRDIAAAAVPSGGGAGGAKDGGSKKIFRRADVLKLMETDRDRYEALSGEIEKAYREGRVR